MAEKSKDITLKGSAYYLRVLISIVVVQLLAIGMFKFWPVSKEKNSVDQNISYNEDDIYLEDAIITRQQSSPPPPPRPQAPVPEPSDKIIEEEIFLDNIEVQDFSDSLTTEEIGLEGETGEAIEDPEESPRVRHIVEPGTPESAREAGIQAKIWVRMLIDRNGKVEDAKVSRIQRFNEQTGEFQTVDEINYGLPEATIKAALQWEFRPARDNGQTVKAYSEQIFTF